MTTDRLAALLMAAVIALALPGAASGSEPSAGDDDGPGTPTAEAVRAHLEAGRYADAEETAGALLEQTEFTEGPDSVAVAEALDLLVESLRRGG